jgi:hypothetical protein
LFSDVSELHTALLNMDAKSFVSHHIFEPVPFGFDGNLTMWIDWKRTLADLIDVDPQDIVMTGSAAVGYSLNPHKSFKPFDAESDYDCGIISGYYFELAWRYLRQLQVSWLTLPRGSKNAISDHRKTYVFGGTIAADKILELLPFGRSWQTALDAMADVDPTKNRDVKLRIYKDYDSLRYYQARNIDSLREQVSGGLDGIDDEVIAQIPVEDGDDAA